MKAERSQRALRTVPFLVVTCLISVPTYAKYSGGTGEPNDPYQIATAGDLMLLGQSVRDYAKHFILTADIDLDPNLAGRKVFDRAVIAPDMDDMTSNFQGAAFSGTLDGQGHTIHGLTVRGRDYLGLVGYVSECGRILNIGLKQVAVAGTGGSIGGLIGYNDHGTVANSYNEGSVSGGFRVGGLAGANYGGVISDCYNTGRVNGTYAVGGLAGDSEFGAILNSFSAGLVSGAGSIGGLVGSRGRGGQVSVLNSFWDVTTSGQSTSVAGTGLTTTQMQDPNTFLNAGWDFAGERGNGVCEIWMMPIEGGYPKLSVFNGRVPSLLKGAGILDDPYIVDTPEDLGTVWYRPAACYRLTSDIDLSGIVWSKAVIPAFAGRFDGQAHRIRNMTISGGGCLGLFGVVVSGAVVCDLGLENVSVAGTSSRVAGLVGENNAGSFLNCYGTGSVSGTASIGGLIGYNNVGGSIAGSHSMVWVSGANHVGGLIGYNRGTVLDSYGTGSTSSTDHVGGLVGYNEGLISNSHSEGPVNGKNYVGGLAGGNYGTISNGYSMGPVNGTDDVGGLVGYGYGGSISNSYRMGLVSGTDRVGGLVGHNAESTVLNSFNTGSASGTDRVGGLAGYNNGTISDSYSMGSVSGTKCVGGLVGQNEGSVSNSRNTGSVIGKDWATGGLVGCNEEPGGVWNSHNIGSASGNDCVGGLAGINYGPISNSYSTGSVSGTDWIGGLVGENIRAAVSKCYSTGSVHGRDYVGGLIGQLHEGAVASSFWDRTVSGQSTSAGGTGLTTAQMQDPNTFLDAGWDFLGERRNGLCEIWMIPAGNECPKLSVPNGYAPPLLTGAGTNEDPYVIETPEDLGTVWHRPRACYELGSDIDLSGIVWSAAIVPVFTGRFDGHGYRIQNVTICGGGYLGLFGILDSNAVLFDLDLEDVSVVGMEYVGGLAGCSWGTISSCQSTGSVNGTDVVGGLVGHAYGGTVSKSCSAGSVSGTFFVGGLVGLNRGIVSSSYSTGSVSGMDYVGGLLGNNRNTASNDYSAGSVSGTHFVGGLVGLNGGLAPYSTVSKSYSIGLVKGEDCVGGLVGDNFGDDSVSNCFWDITTSCQSRSAGGSGLMTDQMRNVRTFLDARWDFMGETDNGTEDIWWIDEGKDYPRLWWEAHD